MKTDDILKAKNQAAAEAFRSDIKRMARAEGLARRRLYLAGFAAQVAAVERLIHQAPLAENQDTYLEYLAQVAVTDKTKPAVKRPDVSSLKWLKRTERLPIADPSDEFDRSKFKGYEGAFASLSLGGDYIGMHASDDAPATLAKTIQTAEIDLSVDFDGTPCSLPAISLRDINGWLMKAGFDDETLLRVSYEVPGLDAFSAEFAGISVPESLQPIFF